MKTYNWGIIGPGRIARKFADDLHLLPNARLHAVASSSGERAREFAATYGAPYAYGRYDDLVHCPGLDVVYIATPHVLHCSNTLMCLERGIPVLCEKPFAMNSAEAILMASTARKHRVFLMEALWTRFIPAVSHAFDLIAQGAIGDLHTVISDFGFHMPFDPAHRIYNKALGGGSLLDIGIYPALLSLFLFGKPASADIRAAATFTQTGVDESCIFSFRYPGNRLASGHSTVVATTPVEARLYGTEGTIHLHSRWHHTQKLTLSRYEGSDEQKQDIDMPYKGWGYSFEAAHVMQCLENGQEESELVPLDFTLGLVETLDAIRQQVGLVY
ncbi:MAG: Gfo/Idh/MocA family oxidoreductase [Lewinellaceae bacterium]|nr:Gfo/Idh/MocA family oxidoreductase [Lewinellaceae bacterium]MCB9355388.1 Gfo/Idh/MocA family oxidoreductase [Lewinellaceae bacterium]